VATILMIFLRVLPKVFLWPHYSELGGRFIEPPEPPVPTPLHRTVSILLAALQTVSYAQ